MINFKSPRSGPRNYLARGEQRRLLTAVLLLGLVFFLMLQARKPSTWYWFVALSQPVNTQADSQTNIDTRLQFVPEREAVEGEFVSPAPKSPPAGAEQNYFPGVEPEHFADVRDDTVFRGAEGEAFFNLLGVLKDNDQQTIRQASSGPAAFAQLFQQSDQYRGRLVDIHGTVWRAFRVEASENDLGIEGYYQVWVQPYDNPGIPIVVYTLDLPPGFPTGMKLREEVEFTGFFFKRWAYKAQDSIRTTPLLLGKTFDWTPPVAPSNEGPSLVDVLTILGAALCVAGIVLVLALRGGRSPAPYAGLRPPRQSIWLAPDETAVSPEEALRRLAEDEEGQDGADSLANPAGKQN